MVTTNMEVSTPLIIAVVLLLAACLLLAVLQGKYRRWPQFAWARGVLKRGQELRDRLEALRNPPRNEQSAAERLAATLFEQQKQGVSVDALKNYKGIGPGTVAILQNDGIRTLPQAEEHANAFLFKKKIQNLGQVREEAIANAVKELLADERRRFEDGRSPEGQQYQSQLAKLSADEQERAAAKAREESALQSCLEKTAPFEALARRVTFASFLFQRDVPGLTADMMATPLPQVDIAPANPLPERGASAPRESQVPPGVARLQAYCNFALVVAKTDGRIAQAERAKIRSYLGELFGSDAMLLRYLDPQLERSEANLPAEADAIAAIQSIVPQTDWPSLYAFAQQIAEATGDATEKEKQFLARLATAFELSPAMEVEKTTLPSPAPVGPGARDLLGIPAKAELSVELIRRKYTMLSEQIDPAKAAALGPEFAAMADAKRAAIQAAALELLAPLGAPLEAPAPPPPSNKMRDNSDLDDLFGSLKRG